MVHCLANSVEVFSNVLAVLAATVEKFFYIISLALNKCAVCTDICKYCIVSYSTCSHHAICKIAYCSRIDFSCPSWRCPIIGPKETMSLEPLLNAINDIFTLNYNSIIDQPCCSNIFGCVLGSCSAESWGSYSGVDYYDRSRATIHGQ
jgi:hypothetical protein